jgi:hypothetical protein
MLQRVAAISIDFQAIPKSRGGSTQHGRDMKSGDVLSMSHFEWRLA